MGQCTSKNETTEGGVYNQMRKSDRQLRTGVKFKDIEFGGFIGFSTVVNDVYTPSGVEKGEVIDRACKIEVVRAVEVDESVEVESK